MIPLRMLPLALRQVIRRPARAVLTAGGTAAAMFLFAAVVALDAGVRESTRTAGADTELVVYRKDRFCPMTSRIPEWYERSIREVDGVVETLPLAVLVNNCRAGLDVVTYRGVPKERFLEERGDEITLAAGSFDDWLARTDAALVGESLAKRRSLVPGDRFEAAGLVVQVAGIVSGDAPEVRNSVWADLGFVQRSERDEVGLVTQFLVRVDDGTRLEEIAAAIDDRFEAEAEPTTTFTRQAFLGRVAGDLLELVSFARWLGAAALLGVLGLVGNAIALSVRERTAEQAVLQTLGYAPGLVARLLVVEGGILAGVGALAGLGAAVLVGTFGHLALSAEGATIPIRLGPVEAAIGFAGALACGTLAGVVPAVRASRGSLAARLRTA